MMKKVGIGIVGAGLVSDSHAAGYIQHQGADLVVVCDLNREIGEHKAKMIWKARKVYTEFEELLEDPDIQAVDIMTPPALHYEMTIKAATSGRHVNCEKPFSVSAAEGREMTEAAGRKGVVSAVDESYLFTTAHMKAREFIASGAIGEPVQIRHYKGDLIQREEGAVYKRRSPDGRTEKPMWRSDPVLSGGGAYPWIFDYAVHVFATTQYLMMELEVDSVFSLPASYKGKSGEDVYILKDYKDIPLIVWRVEDRRKQGYWVRAEKGAHDAYNDRTGFSSVVLGTEGML